MNTHETVYDVQASANLLLSESGVGKIRKIRTSKLLRELRRPNFKACKNAFIRELLPLLDREPTYLM